MAVSVAQLAERARQTDAIGQLAQPIYRDVQAWLACGEQRRQRISLSIQRKVGMLRSFAVQAPQKDLSGARAFGAGERTAVERLMLYFQQPCQIASEQIQR